VKQIFVFVCKFCLSTIRAGVTVDKENPNDRYIQVNSLINCEHFCNEHWSEFCTLWKIIHLFWV